MRSRWDTSPRKTDDGKLIPLIFGEDDFEVCKLLAPERGFRTPWSYQYLPGPYITLLRDRGTEYYYERLAALSCEPFKYIEQSDQPHQNFRSIIYNIGRGGIEKLKDIGYRPSRKPLRRVSHEMYACVTAASFEYTSQQRQGVTVTLLDEKWDLFPDWHVFRLQTPYHIKRIFLEVDTGSKQMPKRPDGSSVEAQIEEYLKLGDELRTSFVIFVTAVPSRVEEMAEYLRKAIDRKRLPHRYALSFGFRYIKYDRFLTTMPKLTDWAVSGDYTRAAGGVFNFLKEGK